MLNNFGILPFADTNQHEVSVFYLLLKWQLSLFDSFTENS